MSISSPQNYTQVPSYEYICFPPVERGQRFQDILKGVQRPRIYLFFFFKFLFKAESCANILFVPLRGKEEEVKYCALDKRDGAQNKSIHATIPRPQHQKGSEPFRVQNCLCSILGGQLPGRCYTPLARNSPAPGTLFCYWKAGHPPLGS